MDKLYLTPPENNEILENSVFWDITQCRSLKINQGLEENIVSELSLTFNRLRSVISQKNRTLQYHHCENLKFNYGILAAQAKQWITLHQACRQS